MPPLPSPIATADVRVWYADAVDIAADADRAARLVGWLTTTERERFDRFYHDIDRHMFLVGRAMARALVGRALGRPPADWRWREGSHGRPEIDEPHVTWHFNIAHSAGLVALALADGREVGVDVENLDRRHKDRAIVARYCSPAEVADVNAQPDDEWHRRFLMYWTLKEAYLKARGLGVSVTLSDVSFHLDGDIAGVTFLESLVGTDRRWLFRLAQPTPQHLLAVAASTADGVTPKVHIDRFPTNVLD